MAYNFNNDIASPAGADRPERSETAPTPAPTVPAADPVAPGVVLSPAFVKFRSCRWQQPAENGNSEFCTHREVKPYAGTTGFDPDAWCPDCQYFKLRRAPKKRSPADEYSY